MRSSRIAFTVFTALVVAFAVWVVLLMVSTRGLRGDLEDRIGWLQELDAIGAAGVSEAAGRRRALHARMLAEAPGPELKAAVEAVDAALTRADEPGLALAVDALRKQVRRENAAILGELGGAWTGMNLVALAALMLAAGSLVQVRISMARTVQTRRLGQQLIAGEARVRAIIELAADAIATVDPRGMIVGVNRAGADMFELGVDEMIGRPMIKLVPGIGRLLRDPPVVPTRLEARRRGDEVFAVGVSVARLEQEIGRAHV